MAAEIEWENVPVSQLEVGCLVIYRDDNGWAQLLELGPDGILKPVGAYIKSGGQKEKKGRSRRKARLRLKKKRR